MSEAALTEFPFVTELPKREKSKVAKLWDQLEQMSAAIEQDGVLLPVGFVVNLVGVSKQRVYQLIEAGTLKTHTFNDHVFVTENSVVEWCKTERKAGRPPKVPTTAKEIWKVARKSSKR